MEFKHNKETGILEAWNKGKKIGEVITMGDMLEEDGDGNDKVGNDKKR